MTWYPELKGKALDMQKTMLNALVAKAELALGLSYQGKQLIIRQLLPTDVGLTTTQDWKVALAATGYGNMIDAQEIDDTRFIGINGISYMPTVTAASGLAEQAFSGIKITRASKTAREWNFQGLAGNGNDIDPTKIGYVDDPVTVDQNQTLTVELYCLTASSSAILELKGLVCEPAGKRIA